LHFDERDRALMGLGQRVIWRWDGSEYDSQNLIACAHTRHIAAALLMWAD